jgi:citrate synthase
MLSLYDAEAQDMSTEANHRKAVRLMSKTASIVTTFDRLRNGKPIVEGDGKLGFAGNFLYTLVGQEPDDVMERAFDVAMIRHADHELNASTFASRVTAATLSDIYSAVTSGIGALKRPVAWWRQSGSHPLVAEIGRRRSGRGSRPEFSGAQIKIPGFGHRVYRTDDPRATHLRVSGRRNWAKAPVRRSFIVCRSEWKRASNR